MPSHLLWTWKCPQANNQSSFCTAHIWLPHPVHLTPEIILKLHAVNPVCPNSSAWMQIRGPKCISAISLDIIFLLHQLTSKWTTLTRTNLMKLQETLKDAKSGVAHESLSRLINFDPFKPTNALFPGLWVHLQPSLQGTVLLPTVAKTQNPWISTGCCSYLIMYG